MGPPINWRRRYSIGAIVVASVHALISLLYLCWFDPMHFIYFCVDPPWATPGFAILFWVIEFPASLIGGGNGDSLMFSSRWGFLQTFPIATLFWAVVMMAMWRVTALALRTLLRD
jgi:hypothetical protein